jgi:phytoene/squalene synthetase
MVTGGIQTQRGTSASGYRSNRPQPYAGSAPLKLDTKKRESTMKVTSTYREFDTVEDMLADILKREGEEALLETILLRREAGLCAQCSKQASDCTEHHNN